MKKQYYIETLIDGNPRIISPDNAKTYLFDCNYQAERFKDNLVDDNYIKHGTAKFRMVTITKETTYTEWE